MRPVEVRANAVSVEKSTLEMTSPAFNEMPLTDSRRVVCVPAAVPDPRWPKALSPQVRMVLFAHTTAAVYLPAAMAEGTQPAPSATTFGDEI